MRGTTLSESVPIAMALAEKLSSQQGRVLELKVQVRRHIHLRPSLSSLEGLMVSIGPWLWSHTTEVFLHSFFNRQGGKRPSTGPNRASEGRSGWSKGSGPRGRRAVRYATVLHVPVLSVRSASTAGVTAVFQRYL